MAVPPSSVRPIAHWRNARAYVYGPEPIPLARWHWEFLRRNLRYQADYERFASLPATDAHRAMLARRYGLDGLMFDYRDSLDPLFQSEREPARVRVVRWETSWIEDQDGHLAQGEPDDLGYLDPRLRQHECCVIFNLREPVGPQLRGAAQRLERERDRHRGKRGNVERYPLYLRLLDADAAGASVAEIAAQLAPDEEGRIREPRIADDLDAARLLRDVNYRYI